jgi:GMP synthase-like glutamine amidotransferase
VRIGILRADAVSAELAAQHGDYPAMFRGLLDAAADGVDPRPPGTGPLEFASYAVLEGRLPPSVDACDTYLITGSRHSVYDDLPWIASLAGFVGEALAAGRRMVAICFGHQLVAHFFGGETRRAAVGWCVGVHEARIVARCDWMTPPAERLRLLASHQDQVVRLPPRAQPFAVGDTCPHAGFVLPAERGPGAVLTLQGHPEFTPAYSEALMDSRRELLGETVYRAGKASLAEPTDHARVAGWMLNFMGSGR